MKIQMVWTWVFFIILVLNILNDLGMYYFLNFDSIVNLIIRFVHRWNVPVSGIVLTNVASHIPSTLPTNDVPDWPITTSGFHFLDLDRASPIPPIDIDASCLISSHADTHVETELVCEIDPLDGIDPDSDGLAVPAKKKRGRKPQPKKLGAPKKGPFVCTDYNLVFDHHIYRDDHVRVAHQKLVYRCQCGKQVQTFSAIKRHLNFFYRCEEFESVSIAD